MLRDCCCFVRCPCLSPPCLHSFCHNYKCFITSCNTTALMFISRVQIYTTILHA
nr:MAG TPA: Maltose-binding periplasmic protein, LINKER, Mitochondrial bond, alpha helix, fusion [Caudoviricetes sp.]